MSNNDKTIRIPFQRQTQSLASALSEKGPAGIILLGIIFFVIWVVPIVFTFGMLLKIPGEIASENGNIFGYASYLVVFLIGLFISVWFPFKLSRLVIESITPVLKAESTSTDMMSGAFGGKVSTLNGKLVVSNLDPNTAKKRVLKIMEALIYRAAQQLELKDVKLIRSNIFVATSDYWLEISNGFHIHMDDENERSIRIPNGGLESGTAYRYFLPGLSVANQTNDDDKVWEHTPGIDSPVNTLFNKQEFMKQVRIELDKVHPQLSWAISMPIPHQVQPFKVASGALNLDGLESQIG